MDESTPATALRFGPFVLHRSRMLLEEGGVPVRLGSRAFELLVALVERAGETVSRDELVARVWPTTVVEDTNLRVHIGALRKALRDGADGARYISNVPGRGYSFVMPVTALEPTPEPARPAATPGAPAPDRPHNLPVRLTRPIGRAAIVAQLAARLEQRRLVSIIGAGGMGKTTVAVAVAEQRLAAYEHGARFVDLAPLSDPGQVPTALGQALGLGVSPEDPWPGLQAHLRDCRMLLVLDNCEHVIDGAARLAEFVLRAADGVQILATSREALAAEGEWVHRLAPLELPDPALPLDREGALGFAAMALFVERASARSDAFELLPEDVPALRRLCHLLDGMPLAIELAAGRVDAFGLPGLAARLDDVFRLLTQGRRTALPRHRTLEALLTWSHDLLTTEERVLLRRLSVFRAGFTMRCAAQVVTDETLPPALVEDAMTSLVAKSLLAVEPDVGGLRYRLLHTTRTYAAARLVQAGERPAFARRHARHFAAELQQAYVEMDSVSTPDWLRRQRHLFDDVHAALNWAFGEDDDLEVGIALAGGTVDFLLLGPLGTHVPELERARRRVAAMVPPQPALELQVGAALCITDALFGEVLGPGGPMAAIFQRTVELARELGSSQPLVRVLHGLCSSAMGRGDYPTLDATARHIRQLARDPSDPLAVLLADRFRAMSCHYLGDQRTARTLAEAVRDHPSPNPHRHFVGLVPRQVSMGCLLARMHWLRAESDQALQAVDEVLERTDGEHPFALVMALATAVLPITLWRGERARARTLTERLMEVATRNALPKWQSWAHNYRFVLRLADSGRERQALLDNFRWPSNAMELDILSTFDEDLVSPGTAQRVADGTVGWCAAEVLRAQALVRWRRDPLQAPAAQALLERSLQIARTQQALAWELRSATTLAALWQAQGQVVPARDLLEPVLERCVEGQGTADVLAARACLEGLR